MNFAKLDLWSIASIKLSVLSATLFLIAVWPQFANWVIKTNWVWFLVVCLILAIYPISKILKK